MPELAEVEFFRKQWDAGLGAKVLEVWVHGQKRIFRGTDPAALVAGLTGAKLLRSETRGKQMALQFSRGGWLGIHLGMTGALRVEAADFQPEKHDHLALRQRERVLVYRDARLFGRVRFASGKKPPAWWSDLPPALTAPGWTLSLLRKTVQRRRPIKAVLLMQELFPGVGNWMADEILWQARIDPRAVAAELDAAQTRRLWQKTRAICRTAMQTIGVDWGDPPAGWLIHVRWKKGGDCPRCEEPLERATIAGRTTAWCARCQSA